MYLSIIDPLKVNCDLVMPFPLLHHQPDNIIVTMVNTDFKSMSHHYLTFNIHPPILLAPYEVQLVGCHDEEDICSLLLQMAARAANHWRKELCRDVVFEELFNGMFDEDEVQYPIMFLVDETAFISDSTSSNGYNEQDPESAI